MSSIRLVSRTTIHLPKKTERSRWELTVTEVAMLPLHYIQNGVLFPKPSTAFDAVVQRLQTSLSHCLLHFPFLSGRLATDAETTIFVDCNDAGAQFVVAKADGLHVSDLMNAVDVPLIVRSFFPMDGSINYDGYSLPLVAVQVTELEDGVFIGCSLNHATADGESFWHFFNSLSELNAVAEPEKWAGGGWRGLTEAGVGRTVRGRKKFSFIPFTILNGIKENILGWRGQVPTPAPRWLRHWLNAGHETISRPPLMERAQIHKELGQVRFPLSEDSNERLTLPAVRERIFRFSAQAIARIKAKANERSKLQRGEISSLQALVGLMWRTITRARKLQADQTTACKLAAGLRKRLDPPLPREYFGSCVLFFLTEAKVGELLGQDLGWAARALHETVIRQTANVGQQRLMNIQVHDASGFESSSVRVACSPLFEMYGSDFGWGKGLVVLSGSANKFDGKISVFPGKVEGGSIDLEVCLLPHVMAALELDEELLDALLPSY